MEKLSYIIKSILDITVNNRIECKYHLVLIFGGLIFKFDIENFTKPHTIKFLFKCERFEVPSVPGLRKQKSSLPSERFNIIFRCAKLEVIF